MGDLTFATLREANLRRCSMWHPGGVAEWSLSDWGVAAAGEMGEACDVIKKLNRIRDGLTGNKQTPAQLERSLGEEIADTLLYLDLLAARAGIDLAQAVVDKFNAVSDRNGFDIKLVHREPQ